MRESIHSKRHLVLFDRMSARRSKLIQRVSDWTEGQLQYRPPDDNDAWCTLQVLDHLCRSEALFRRSCEQALTRPSVHVSFTDRRRALCFIWSLRLPIRLRLPAALEAVRPGEPNSLATLLERWNSEHDQLKQFLKDQGSSISDGGVVKHPATGYMDLPTSILFLSVHLRHHEYQITLRSLGYLGWHSTSPF